MRTLPHVSAIEQQILTESLRRIGSVRPDVAMVMAEIFEADEHELGRLAHALTPEEAALALNQIGQVIAETGGQA